MWAIYDLQCRGIRLRSLAGREGQWTRYLDADPDSPEVFMGNVLASMAAYVTSQERQNISRRTRAGLDAALDRARTSSLIYRSPYPSGTSTSWKTETAEMTVGSPSRVAHTCTV